VRVGYDKVLVFGGLTGGSIDDSESCLFVLLEGRKERGKERERERELRGKRIVRMEREIDRERVYVIGVKRAERERKKERKKERSIAPVPVLDV
jgi:hypothetical protein